MAWARLAKHSQLRGLVFGVDVGSTISSLFIRCLQCSRTQAPTSQNARLIARAYLNDALRQQLGFVFFGPNTLVPAPVVPGVRHGCSESETRLKRWRLLVQQCGMFTWHYLPIA